jgi:hypothetical protein
MIVTEGGEFSIRPGHDAWTGGNARVGLTVISSDDNCAPSKLLNQEPALCWISNALKPFQPGSPQEQVMIGELNGVFVHVKVMHGRVHIVMADRRLS